MYKDKDNGTLLRSLTSIVLIILILCLLIYLGYKLFNDNKNVKDATFINNVETMKNAAKNYFTVDILPSEMDESKTLTLQEMIEEKLLIEFTDSNNKKCNAEKSYVKVTKSAENKYSLKIKLVCGNVSDFIIDTIGCNSTCGNTNCEECNCNEGCEDVTEYQYKKTTTKNTTIYSCPSGYKRNGKYCYKTTSSSEVPVSYNGSGLSRMDSEKSEGSISRIYDNVIVTGGETTYSCPTGYSLNTSDKKCYRYIESTISYQDNWVCPTGYTRDGTTCYKETEPTINYEDGKCTCPSGYKLNDAKTKCVKYTNASKKYGNWGNPDSESTTTVLASQSCPKSSYTGTTYKRVVTSVVRGNYRYCTTKEYSRSVSYYCSSGSLYSGTKCKITKNPTCQDDKPVYICSVGTLTSNNKCRVTTNATNEQRIVRSCPADYTLTSNNQCYRKTNPTINNVETKYSCNDGYTLTYENGYKCYKEIKTEGHYYCALEGYYLKEGSLECEKTYDISGTKVCPCGYTLKDTKCYKDTTEKIKASSSTKPTTSTEYKWSTAKTLSGWTSTGKTRKTNTCSK